MLKKDIKNLRNIELFLYDLYNGLYNNELFKNLDEEQKNYLGQIQKDAENNYNLLYDIIEEGVERYNKHLSVVKINRKTDRGYELHRINNLIWYYRKNNNIQKINELLKEKEKIKEEYKRESLCSRN